MQTLLSKAFVASVTVAGLGLLAAPQANAATTLFGSFALSGPSSLSPGTGVADPGSITPTIIQSFCDAGTNAFTSCNGSSIASISGLGNFTSLGGGLYSLPSFDIVFSSGVIPPGVNPLTITVSAGTYGRTGGTESSNLFTFPNQLTAVDTEGNTYQGTFSIGNAGGSSTFQMNFATDNVPEPLTMLGASAAVAFGAAFKRRNANKG